MCWTEADLCGTRVRGTLRTARELREVARGSCGAGRGLSCARAERVYTHALYIVSRSVWIISAGGPGRGETEGARGFLCGVCIESEILERAASGRVDCCRAERSSGRHATWQCGWSVIVKVPNRVTPYGFIGGGERTGGPGASTMLEPRWPRGVDRRAVWPQTKVPCASAVPRRTSPRRTCREQCCRVVSAHSGWTERERPLPCPDAARHASWRRVVRRAVSPAAGGPTYRRTLRGALTSSFSSWSSCMVVLLLGEPFQAFQPASPLGADRNEAPKLTIRTLRTYENRPHSSSFWLWATTSSRVSMRIFLRRRLVRLLSENVNQGFPHRLHSRGRPVGRPRWSHQSWWLTQQWTQ